MAEEIFIFFPLQVDCNRQQFSKRKQEENLHTPNKPLRWLESQNSMGPLAHWVQVVNNLRRKKTQAMGCFGSPLGTAVGSWVRNWMVGFHENYLENSLFYLSFYLIQQFGHFSAMHFSPPISLLTRYMESYQTHQLGNVRMKNLSVSLQSEALCLEMSALV